MKLPFRLFGAALLISLRIARSALSQYRNIKARVFSKKMLAKKPISTATNSRKPIKYSGPQTARVAVLIPVYNNWAYTRACLQSLETAKNKTNFDVYVADDCSTDGTEALISEHFPGVKVISNKENLGFIRSCNNAFKNINEYEFIYLLNNDAEATDNFLDYSIELMEKTPKAASVVAKLIYPDGVLQEAGSIVWRDVTAHNFGRNADASQEKYNVARQVDYGSGAALLIKTEALIKADYFSDEFVPAYYDDVDLAFKFRKLGYEVWYCPESVVIHHEGKSHGTDINVGIKKYQVLNQKKFAKKWAFELTEYPAFDYAAEDIAAYKWNPELNPDRLVKTQRASLLRSVLSVVYFFLMRNEGVKISDYLLGRNPLFSDDIQVQDENEGRYKPGMLLVIDQSIPAPDQHAGDLTLFTYLEAFVLAGHKVCYLPADGKRNPFYENLLEDAGVVVAVGHTNTKQWLYKNGHNFNQVFIARPQIASDLISDLRNVGVERIVYYTHDLHFKRLMDQFKLQRKLSILVSSFVIKRVEKNIFNNVDQVISPSSDEVSIIRKISKAKNVSAIPPYLFSEEQIFKRDLDYFKANKDLLFVGGFPHSPNVDAAIFLVNEIMPIVWQTHPELKVYLVGYNPPQEVLDLMSDRVTVTGKVPDLKPYFDAAGIFVAPIRFGAGVKGKTVDAFRFGLPVVGSKYVFEGIPVSDTYQPEEIITADGYAKRIEQLLASPELCLEMSQQGQQVVRSHFSKSRFKEIVESILPLGRNNGSPES